MAIQVLFTIYTVIDNNIVLNILTKSANEWLKEEQEGQESVS